MNVSIKLNKMTIKPGMYLRDKEEKKHIHFGHALLYQLFVLSNN
ncbi:hypothetical protein [Peribacillus sp. CSMR9]|nr:hypothetical protein [Peribacillus sp. CSMR9]MDV7765814.1 hypothetical protein [Peribacillus sp. CSMR9]